MWNPEEPASKRRPSDYSLCIKCQCTIGCGSGDESTAIKRVKERKEGNAGNFLEEVEERAKYGNPDYISLAQRLNGITADDLKKNDAIWHISCYKEVTHKEHCKRDKKQFEEASKENDCNLFNRGKGRPSSSPSTVLSASSNVFILTRQNTPLFENNSCFYCQHDRSKKGGHGRQLPLCKGITQLDTIQKIVDRSQNDLLRYRLNNVRSKQCLLYYHKACHLRQLKISNSSMTNIEEFDTQVEFLAIIEDELDKSKIITIPEAKNLYLELLHQEKDIEDVVYNNSDIVSISNIEDD
ncbi:hypothetical protein SNE40_018189 [Patella caerulea]|uniref:Uncharacterized protein n=1 Tax=Patella caerulea TaxID=87958 RepID=A0AAN8J980_PATCE